MPSPTGKAWADGPFELIETPEFATKNASKAEQDYIKSASFMALMHNILIRGLNTIHQQAPHVQPDDLKDFIGYSLCFCEVLDNHTRGEEVHMFPEIEKAVGQKGLMDFNKEEHDAFEPALLAFKTYLQTVQSNPAEYSAPTFLSLLTTFSNPLISHLRSEIPFLVSLSRFGSSLPILKITTSSGKTMTEELPKETGFMFFLLNNDLTYEGGKWSKWPPIPGLAKSLLFKMNMGKNKGWWRFASCGSDGKPHALLAVG